MAAHDRSVQPVMIPVGDQLELEAEFAPSGHGESGSDIGVVITHPHPLQGGSMHTPVPDALFAEAQTLGLAALRFNFRGVGSSTGTHDNGVGERDDVRAAMADLRARSGVDQIVLAGWSFGADVALAVQSDEIVGWFAVAPPLRVVPTDEMASAPAVTPKLLAVPQHDQFNPPDVALEATVNWTNTTIATVDGADHFLAGQLAIVAELFNGFVGTLSNSPAD